MLALDSVTPPIFSLFLFRPPFKFVPEATFFVAAAVVAFDLSDTAIVYLEGGEGRQEEKNKVV